MSMQTAADLALCAQASYASLSSGDALDILASKLQSEQGGLVQTQAQQFAAKHSVVLQYDDRLPGGNNTACR